MHHPSARRRGGRRPPPLRIGPAADDGRNGGFDDPGNSDRSEIRPASQGRLGTPVHPWAAVDRPTDDGERERPPTDRGTYINHIDDLPDELVLAVLGHVDPLCDTMAVSLTCHRWRRIMLDQQLWRGFYERLFPECFAPDAVPNEIRAVLGPDDDGLDHRGRSAEPWRRRFVSRARKLKRGLKRLRRWPERLSLYDGWDWRTVAAAAVGSLPLVERWADRLLEVAFADHQPSMTSAFGLQSDEQQQQQQCEAEMMQTSRTEKYAGEGGEDGHRPPACERPEANRGSAVDRRRLNEISLSNVPPGPCLNVVECSIVMADNSAPVAKFFLDLGARIDSDAVEQAARKGNRQLVALLIARGANVNRHDVHHQCELHPLNVAVRAGNIPMIKLLLRHGAETRTCTVSRVLESLRPDVLLLLMEHGYVPCTADVESLLRSEHGTGTNRKGLRKSYLEMLRLLASALRSTFPSPSLSFRLFTSKTMAGTGDVEACRLLVENGADIDAISKVPLSSYDLRSSYEMTPLHYAVQEGNEKLARCLLACGARTDIKTSYADCSITALSMARQLGRQTIARLIARRRSKRSSPSSGGCCMGDVCSSPPSRRKEKRRHEEEPEDAQVSRDDRDDGGNPPENHLAKRKRTETSIVGREAA